MCANYMEFVLVGLFGIRRNLHFFDSNNLLKLLFCELFFECSLNYPEVNTNSFV